MQPRGRRRILFPVALEPRAPGQQPLSPRSPYNLGRGSQTRRARSALALPTPARLDWVAPGQLPKLRGSRRARLREARGSEVGPGLRGPRAAAARTHLPYPAPRRPRPRSARSPTAGRGRLGAPDAPCRAAHSRPDPLRPASSRPHAGPAARLPPLPARNFTPPAPSLNGSWVRTGSCSFMPG